MALARIRMALRFIERLEWTQEREEQKEQEQQPASCVGGFARGCKLGNVLSAG